MAERPPVIVLGMHRSGTSLVIRLLAAMGLFIGRHRDVNDEAWFFLRLNEWLLRQCGGGWDHPEPIRHLLADPAGRRLTVGYLRYVLGTPRVAAYLGAAGYLRHRRPERLPRPWGWKDPRNTYTLPLWLDLFPGARVIHVFRHGVDVAASLQRRQAASVGEAERRFRRLRALHALLPRRGGFAESWRCGDLDEALGLWRGYLEQARRHVAVLGGQACEVCYEDLLAAPHERLRALADFCGLPVAAPAVARAAGLMRASRALAYRDDPALRAAAERWQAALRTAGYTP